MVNKDLIYPLDIIKLVIIFTFRKIACKLDFDVYSSLLSEFAIRWGSENRRGHLFFLVCGFKTMAYHIAIELANL